MQTVAGHPLAWVNNEFRQYVYDVSDLVVAPAPGDNNITVAFESAYLYGLNVTSLPNTEVPLTPDVSLILRPAFSASEKRAVRVCRLPPVSSQDPI